MKIACLRDNTILTLGYVDGKVIQFVRHHGLRDAQGGLLAVQDSKRGCGFFGIRVKDDRDALLNA